MTESETPAQSDAAIRKGAGEAAMIARGAKMAPVPIGPFDQAAVSAYAAASGDDNPLHSDPAIAAQAGFSAPPVQGMLLMAAIEPALRRWRADLRLKSLACQFIEPLLVGEQAHVSAKVVRVEAGGALARVTIQGPRRGPSLLAEARLEILEGFDERHR